MVPSRSRCRDRLRRFEGLQAIIELADQMIFSLRTGFNQTSERFAVPKRTRDDETDVSGWTVSGVDGLPHSDYEK